MVCSQVWEWVRKSDVKWLGWTRLYAACIFSGVPNGCVRVCLRMSFQ